MSEISLKDIEALIDSGKLSESDMRVLEAQLTKLEKKLTIILWILCSRNLVSLMTKRVN